MNHLENDNELKLVGLTVLKFTAEWCAPCKRFDSILQKMEKEFPEVKFIYVDIDKCTKTAQKYRVKSVPTLVFFNGEEESCERVVGVIQTEPIRKIFKSFAKNDSKEGE